MDVLKTDSDSPQTSSALRYERVAQLEAVLTLRDQRQRARFRNVLLGGLTITAVCTIATMVMMRGLT